MDIVIQLLWLALGFFLLVKGADWFVDGAAGLAEKFGIPQLVIGLTIVAMGTSAPEAAVSITAAIAGNADITIGNVVGSNILNILLILGVASTITPLAVARSTVKYEIPFVIIVSFLLLVLGLDGTVSRLDSIALIAAFILYLVYLFRLTKEKEKEPELVPAKRMSIPKALILLVIGLVMIIGGSHFVVDAASYIATAMGVSQRLIGLTIVAFGTSLPELVTSVAAARKKNADIAIGNIVGSNIFNILFVTGITAAIIPVPFSPAFIPDTLIAAGAAALLLAGCLLHKSLIRRTGVSMLIAYAVYFGYSLM